MKKYILYSLIAIIASCTHVKKESDQKLSGVVPDDPKELVKVNRIVSEIPKVESAVAAPVTCYFTNPAPNSKVSGTVTVSISAAVEKHKPSSYGLASTKLIIDNVVQPNSSPVQAVWSWVPTTGIHTLTATAIDTRGRSATSTIQVSKDADIIVVPPPTEPLPTEFILKAPPHVPQGSEGSCLANALMASRSINEYYKTGATSYSESTNIYTPEFMFDLAKVGETCGIGSAMLNSLNIMYGKGSLPWVHFPYDPTNGCATTLITPAMYTVAANHKIKNYASILSTNPQLVKQTLVSGISLPCTFIYDDNYFLAKEGTIWASRANPSITNGPHAGVIIGYSDSKKAFLLRGTWGPTWGSGGNIWVDYTFFPTVIGYLWRMEL